MLAHRFFQAVVRRGQLGVIYADGTRRDYGNETEPGVVIRLRDRATERRLLLNPKVAFGEAYMDGGLILEAGSLRDLLAIATASVQSVEARPVGRLISNAERGLRHLRSLNPVGRAQRNVAHHYDLSGELYDLFLDSDRQYSCAYFETPEATLEEAQNAKKRHLAAKLNIDRAGLSILDIGCGWGGLAIYLAETTGAKVTGITLSKEQHAVSQARARAAGLEERVSFLLCDYRQVAGQFDRIVSVGMFEHVGIGYYTEYFQNIERLLTPDGVALVHTIGRLDPPAATNPWIAKYIFPGGYIPALSEMSASVEPTGLMMTDIEILRLHYAETLREWRRRFMARRDEALKIYDERFCRMWEFYLAGSETSFRHEGMVNFQMQITRKIDALPLTRDYMIERERAMEPKILPHRLAGD
jgi:cyclopropane-fatty-acyl-phospholipid synthase